MVRLILPLPRYQKFLCQRAIFDLGYFRFKRILHNCKSYIEFVEKITIITTICFNGCKITKVLFQYFNSTTSKAIFRQYWIFGQEKILKNQTNQKNRAIFNLIEISTKIKINVSTLVVVTNKNKSKSSQFLADLEKCLDLHF